MTLVVDYETFPTRLHRARYIANRYRPLLTESVLDVGCDTGVLKGLIPASEYIGIDVTGTPDILLNLESVTKIPFPDDSFDSVVCTDVLEHLDNLHVIFQELLRVCRGSVILSLPNCWCSARQPMDRGRGRFLHYGLPLEALADRHKWFFNVTDAVGFLEGKSRQLGFQIRDLHVTEKPRRWLVKALRRGIYPRQEHYLNRYAHTIWAVLDKSAAETVAQFRVA